MYELLCDVTSWEAIAACVVSVIAYAAIGVVFAAVLHWQQRVDASEHADGELWGD